ncbi:MAG: hypothetical protein ACKOF3_05800, partial [Spartobacteria bacterium]
AYLSVGLGFVFPLILDRQIRREEAPAFQAIGDILLVELSDIFAIAVDVDHRHGHLPIDSFQPVQVPIQPPAWKKSVPAVRLGVDRIKARPFIALILKHAM